MNEAVATFSQRLEYFGMDRLVRDADLVLVAFSGGADSSLLLYLLCEYLKDCKTKLAAAHLNHMIRGDEAIRDENFAVEFGKSLGVHVYVKRVDIPSLAKDGGSIEEVARRERYAFFNELTESLGGRVIVATAHNADDNLETVLFNLVRGSGTAGLCGIPPIRDGVFIRPLITYSSGEIRTLCDKLGISYVVDSTNLCDDYTRNKLRHIVIPHLKEINPSAVKAALRMNEALREDNAFIENAAEAFLEQYGGEAVAKAALLSLDNAVLTRVLRRMHGRSPSLENIHIREIIRHLREKSGDFELSVPGNVIFACRAGECSFSEKTAHEAPDKSTDILQFDRPTHKNGYVLLMTKGDLCKNSPTAANIYNLSIHKAVKFDKINSKLEVRTRIAGDTIKYGGMTRKLKKLFSEKKLSERERECIPVVCDGDGILWVPSFPLRDGMTAEKGEEAVHLFCFKESDFEKTFKNFYKTT